MHHVGMHADWLIEGVVFLILGLVSLLFTFAFGFFHAFLYAVFPAILIVAGIVLLVMYAAKRK